MMKTLILATAAMLALGTGAAFAGEGGTAVQAQWDRANGIHSWLEEQYYGYPQTMQALTQQQHQQRQQGRQRTAELAGSGWNSNG